MRQIVRPAGPGRETLWVSLAAGAVLVAAAAVVGLRTTAAPTARAEAHQVDARTDLTPAEQGIFADLRIAAPEIALYPTPPSPDVLAADTLPPFARDAGWRTRGAHAWVLLDRTPDQTVYLGRTTDPAVAGSFLLRLEDGTPDIWLKAADAAPPPHPAPSALAADGWKQVIFSFTTGATR